MAFPMIYSYILPTSPILNFGFLRSISFSYSNFVKVSVGFSLSVRVKCLSDELASKANREHVGQTSSDVNSDGAVEENRIHQGKRSFIIEKNIQTFKRMFKKSDNSLS